MHLPTFGTHCAQARTYLSVPPHMPRESILLRTVLLLIALYLIYDGLILLDDLLIPLAYAGIVACILLPSVRQLEHRGVNRLLASFICVLLFVLGAAGVGLILVDQAAMFGDDIPTLRLRSEQMYIRMTDFLRREFNVGPNDYVANRLDKMLAYLTGMLESTLMATGNILTLVVLVPLFTFFLLSYRDIVRKAAVSLARPKFRPTVPPVLDRVQHVMGQYALGLLTVWVGVAVMFFIVLAMLGVPHAPFFAIVGALLNLIPYVGILIGASAPALYGSLMLGEPFLFIIVFLGLWGVHAVEANVLTPAIVGRRVKMNPLAALIAVIIGGEVWGLSGMILALPYTAVIKIMAENIPALHFLAILIGDRNSIKDLEKPLLDTSHPDDSDLDGVPDGEQPVDQPRS